MAEVVRVKPLYVSPPGYEVIDTGTAVEAISAGMLASLGVAGWSKLAAGETEPDGVALQDYAAGQVGCDFGIQCEVDGYTGLTPGAPLYPSATVAGGIQDVAVTATVRMKATTATRIRFNLV